MLTDSMVIILIIASSRAEKPVEAARAEEVQDSMLEFMDRRPRQASPATASERPSALLTRTSASAQPRPCRARRRRSWQLLRSSEMIMEAFYLFFYYIIL